MIPSAICGCGRVVVRIASDSGTRFMLERIPRVLLIDGNGKPHLFGAGFPDLYVDHAPLCGRNLHHSDEVAVHE